MGYKVCVYAISKNEVRFAKRWYDSMKEADYVCVLDTGSDDGTYEMFRGLGAITRREVINPWRFDIARNLSMELIPEDADICVCTDIDEVFEPGWREKLEAAWTEDTTGARYRYTWNFNQDGSEGTVFYIEKAHKNGDFIWKHPVHEVLTYTGKAPRKTVLAKGVQLNHRADNTKSRASYLPLLELSVKEEPEDDRNMHYLGREYMYRGMWDKSIETLKKHLLLPSAVWKDERCASMRYIARCFREKNDDGSAVSWLYRAIAEAPYLREPYTEMAKLMCSMENWEGTVFMAKEALKIKERPASYISDAECWGPKLYDLLSLGYYYSGRYEEALSAAKEALDIAPTDERLRNNVAIIESAVAKHCN